MSGRFERRNSAGERVCWVEATYNPIVDADGKVYKVIKFVSRHHQPGDGQAGSRHGGY